MRHPVSLGFLVLSLLMVIEAEPPEAEPVQLPIQGAGGPHRVTARGDHTETNHAVSGNGNLSGADGAVAITVTGTHTNSSVSMTWTATGYEPLNFSGTVGADGLSMTGSLNGSGFQNFALTLSRPKS